MIFFSDATLYPQYTTDAKGSRSPSGQAVTLPAGSYNQIDLKRKFTGGYVFWISVLPNTHALLYTDADYSGHRWIVGAGNWDLSKLPDAAQHFWENKYINSLIVVNDSEIPAGGLASPAVTAFWNARAEQAKSEYAQRVTTAQQVQAARAQAEAVVAARTQADAQAAALQAQVDAATRAAELQRALAEQQAQHEAAVRQREAAQAALEAAQAEYAAATAQPTMPSTSPVAVPVPVVVPPVAPPASALSHKLLYLGVAAAALYFFTRRTS